MKTAIAFTLINIIILSVHLLAASVVVILAPMARALVPEADNLWWPWAIIMAIATALALNVMKAATTEAS